MDRAVELAARGRNVIGRFLRSHDLSFPIAAFLLWRAAQAVTLAAFGGGAARVQETGYYPISNPGIFRWDGVWYQLMMRQGYEPVPDQSMQPTAFFPLLSWLARLVQYVVRSEPAAALITVNIAALAASILVYKVVRVWKDERVAKWAVVLLLAFPSSMFLAQVYTEGLFIALCAGALLAVAKDKMWLAGLLVAGAAMTRPPGIFLIPIALIAYLERHRTVDRSVAWLGLGIAGFSAVVIAQAVQAGDGLAFTTVESAWGRSLTTPWRALTTSLRSYLTGNGPPTRGWAFSTLSTTGSPRDVGAAYLFLALGLISLFRSWPWSARLLIFAMTLGPLSTAAVLSTNRYVLAAWPAFAVLGELLVSARRWLQAVVVSLFVAFSILVIHDWANGRLVG